MLELTINEKVYPFKFGLGFVREINKTMSKPIEGVTNGKQDVGLQFAVAAILDEDPVGLVDVLDIANKTEMPRVTKKQLDAYIEDESTDLEALFAEVLDNLKSANATKKVTAAVLAMVEEAKAEAAAKAAE